MSNNEPKNNDVKMSGADMLNLKKVKYFHDRKMLRSETNDVVENLSNRELCNLVNNNCNSAKKFYIKLPSTVPATTGTTESSTIGLLTLFNGLSDDECKDTSGLNNDGEATARGEMINLHQFLSTRSLNYLSNQQQQ